MDCTRRFPPGIAGMERLLGSVADLRDDSAGNDECYDAIGVKMRWGVCCRRISHFDQADISQRLARQLLPDHVAASRSVWGCLLLRGSRAVGHSHGGKQGNQRTAIEMAPAEDGFDHRRLFLFWSPFAARATR